ncbi:MAG TPA: acyl-CoA dehydrogenase family protein [Methylomirabilota bacterium]|jgi:3-hydroxy-9,10-secoandrosta-1,3,5(10)-triene-9,17-dione monooxygenase|nr:acyl-CoA dehydrogenase family protein [Methylomirabilota bacterium]
MTARGFADVTYEDILRRARELAPILRERAASAEANRQMEKTTLDDLHRQGLFRFHQPKRWGGLELPFPAIFDVPYEIARGCASTAWNVANLGIHHWMLALYDERAQEEVWGPDPDALIASGIAYPQGQGRRVEGGFLVSGFWNFSSGVDPATWNMLAVTVREGDRVVDHRMCLVPRGEYEIVDDWQVLGMRSTGSKSVRATNVFVPEHRALCMYLARGGTEYPGARVNANPLYRIPLSALGSHCLAAAGVGNAQAAVEMTIEAIKERSTNYTGLRMRDFQAVQLRVARAGAQVDAARLSIRTDCVDAERIAQEGRAPTLEEKLRFKRNVAWAMEQCTEAIDSLHALAGANGIYDRYPIQRLFRDQHALSAHIGFSWDAQGGPWALVAMGGEFLSPTM